MLPLVLYDTPGNKIKAWNGATLRIRYCLGIKNIPYTTMWVEYPDIEPTLRALRAAPTGVVPDFKGGERPFYTVPAITDPNTLNEEGKPTVVVESSKIAAYLDKYYPGVGPVLVPSGTKGFQAVFEDYILKTFIYPCREIIIPSFYENLTEGSKPYFRMTREAFVGKKIEEMCPLGSPEREATWAVAKKTLNDLASLLDKKGESGPFITGSAPCFADFVFVGILEAIFRMLPKEWEENVATWNDGRWETLRRECAKYLKAEN